MTSHAGARGIDAHTTNNTKTPGALTPPHEELNACANAIGASSSYLGGMPIHLTHPLQKELF